MTLQDRSHPSALPKAILQTAAYADVFDFPLTAAEIHRYLIGVRCSHQEVAAALNTGILSLTGDGFYTLPGRESLASLRRSRAETASALWPRAIRFGLILARLPFVRLVAVTGALAMNNVEPDADVDLFIVTEPGRLWFCRGLVLLVARLATRQRVTLCPNYLVSLRALHFPDQTLYAAHEIAQMVPLAGFDVYRQIRAYNAWMLFYLPNAVDQPPRSAPTGSRLAFSLSRPDLESILNKPPFTALEQWEMNRKIRKLRHQQGDSAESLFSADICKGHAHHHGKRTAAALADRLHRLNLDFSL